MNKVKYLIKRISAMDFSNFFKYIDIINDLNGKNKLLIFLDVVYCGLVYQAGYVDYYLIRLDLMNKEERKTVVTRGKNNQFIKFFNNQKIIHVFHNKYEFNIKFKNFIKRDWIYLDNNYEEFLKFINNKEDFIAKPLDGSCGIGIEKLKTNQEHSKLYDYLVKNKILLLEEVIKQDEEINKIYPYSINTLRVITLTNNNRSTVLSAYLRIGNNNKFVDNFNSGGMVVPININTGVIEFGAIDRNNIIYEKHPMTNEKIKGFKVPKWNLILDFAKELAQVEKEVGMVGWDISLTTTGPDIVEGNEFPTHDFYQLPPHRINNKGLLPRFYEALEEIGLNKKDIK